jgi:hypothetical protein
MAKKPGPRPFKPSAIQRRRVLRGIAVGLTLEQLAADLGMALGSMRKTFDTEIRLGRVRAILDNLDRLHEAADNGNVSAMRELARMMQPAVKAEDTEEDDPWADVVDRMQNDLAPNVPEIGTKGASSTPANSGRNRDFH